MGKGRVKQNNGQRAGSRKDRELRKLGVYIWRVLGLDYNIPSTKTINSSTELFRGGGLTHIKFYEVRGLCVCMCVCGTFLFDFSILETRRKIRTRKKIIKN